MGDYYNDGKCKIYKNSYCKIYKFDRSIDYYNAIKELDRHELKYEKVFLRKVYGYYIITSLVQEIIDFLNVKLRGLKTKDNGACVFYLENFNNSITKTIYFKIGGLFYLDYKNIWDILRVKYGLEYNAIEAIIGWYTIKNLHPDCKYTKWNDMVYKL